MFPYSCDFQAGCPVVAAFLHYFLLALFSWMLCEGALHYILLVKVFGGGAEDKVKYFYMFGWGRLPCTIHYNLFLNRIKIVFNRQDMHDTEDIVVP